MEIQEHETAFIFDYEHAVGINGYGQEDIKDYYFDSDFRYRISSKNQKIEVTQKLGDKASGVRTEITSLIDKSDDLEKILNNKAKLIVQKTRKIYANGLTIDLVHSPMQIAILEIETNDKDTLLQYQMLAKSVGLKPCPLNAWDYHKRKIGIMGGPSSGKTTVAKTVSTTLNNKYNANTSDVVEYATSFIQKTGRTPSFEDQSWIFLKQSEREYSISNSANIVLSDCPVFLAYIYAIHALRDRNGDSFTDYAINSLYKRSVRSLNDYQMLYILETINYKKNNVRYHSLEQSKKIYQEIHNFVVNHGRKHLIKQYNFNNTDDIINDILYFNDSNKIDKFVNMIGKYRAGGIAT